MATTDTSLEAQIASWLIDRGQHVAAWARTWRVPMSIALPIPMAEAVPDGGYKLWTDQRPASVFALSPSSDPSFYMRVTGQYMDFPLLDTTAESLAQQLVLRCKDLIKYLCRFSPTVLGPAMQHPDTLPTTPKEFSTFEESMLSWEPLFYAFALLHQCVFEYLRTITPLDAQDGALASRLAHELVAYAEASECTHLARIPLAGLDIDDDQVEVESCTIKRLTGEELGQMYSERQATWVTTKVAHSLPARVDARHHVTERVVLEVRERHSKREYYAPALVCQKLLLALHILEVRYAGAGRVAMLEEPLWVHPDGRSVYPLLMPSEHVACSVPTHN